MREFGQIPSSLWLREDLSFHAKALYAYLLSSPHANFLGCFLCREGYVVADTGMSRAALRRGFAQLEAAGLAYWLGACVYLPGQVAAHAARNESVVAARLGCWRELPAGEAKARVAAELLVCYDKLNERQRGELSAYVRGAPQAGVPTRAHTEQDINADTDADIKRTDSREWIVNNTPHSPPPAAACAAPLGGQRVRSLAPVFPDPDKAPAQAPPNLVAAILVVTGNDPAKATGPLLRAAQKSVAAVLAVEPNLSPESLAAASEAYRQKYRDCVISPRALARNWSNVVGTAPPRLAGARLPTPLDPYCPPPEGWRGVLARLHNLDLEALEGREWAALGTDLRKGVLAELAKCAGRQKPLSLRPTASPTASGRAALAVSVAAPREEVQSGR